MSQSAILAIECSTGPASIALIAADGSVIAHHEHAERQQQAAQLVGNIDTLVRNHVDDYSTLEAIAVSTGPGGFTGIRIALAAARGIALAAQKPIIGISTLETLAWQAEEGKVCALVDAYRGQAYAQSFIKSASALTPQSEALTLDHDKIEAWLASESPDAIIGNLAIEREGHEKLEAPSAIALGQFAWQVKEEDRPAEAFYIRPPDAKPQAPLLERL